MFAVFATHNKKAKLFGPTELEKEMTAESLKKPFLSLSAPYSKKEKNDCCRKLPIFITVTLFVIICASVSISQIWNSNRINELQNEVDHLKNVVDEMRKHLGFDLYDDLRNFQEDYDRRSDDSVTDKYDKSLGSHRKASEIGSGNDDTYEDEDDNIREDDTSDPDYLEDDSFAYDDDTLDDASDDNDVPKDGDEEKRLKRSITGQTSQGVPILEESYASSRRNQTDDFISNLLGKNENEDPKLKLYWHNKMEQQFRKNMQQQGRQRHDKHDHRQKIIIREHEAVQHTYGAQNPLHTRRNRVMNTNEDKSKAFRQVISKSEYDNMGGGPRNYAEQRQAPEQVVYKHRSMGKRNLKRSRPVAIHYIREQLPHRRGGNYMYGGSDSNRSFCDWVPAPWNKQLDLHSNYFVMTNGVLTVRESGLYFIYAQIFYHDDHDTNGYIIEKNQEIFLQCTTMTHSVHRLSKSNSCYTGALVLINSGDTIRLMDLGSDRMTLGDSSKSFFGLVKLGDAKAPTTDPSTY